MGDVHAMLEAHVRFELERWTDAGVRKTVRQEVDAAFVWLRGVPLSQVAPRDAVRACVVAVITAPPTPELTALVADLADAVHAVLSEDDASLADLVAQHDYDHLVETVVELRQLRVEVIEQVTTSSVYAKLIGYVLYHGIKDYLTTQNVFARKIPGASSMLRFGQSAVSAAAPGLERSVDRQLAAFIAANVEQTSRGSASFLTELLNDDTVRAVAAELWRTNADRPLADLASLIEQPSVAQAVDAAAVLWESGRTAPALVNAVTAALDRLYSAHAERPAVEFLDSLGLSADGVSDLIADLATPMIATARESGYLEARIRARLEPFYATQGANPTEAD